LPDGYRSVVNLHIFEGYPHKEIAEIMGISESTSKSQLSKAKKFLRKKLEEKNKVLKTVTENG
jgi:RNA polymerase sigma-70 factor (ECF subfamily)